MPQLGFRLAGSYLALYTFPGLPNQFPGAAWLSDSVDTVWRKVVPWVGAQLLRMDIPPGGPVRGDTLFGVTRVLCCLILAIVVTALWTQLDRRRPGLRPDVWGRVYLRYALGLAMLGYGLVKIFDVQYPELPLDRMFVQIGDLTPQALLWTFMQGSRTYTLFAGSIETTAAALLFFHRTSVLGTLLALAAMINVVTLNWAYDVNVKLHSTHLLAMALFLAVPTLSGLFRLLLRPRRAAVNEPSSSARYALRGLKAVFVGLALFGFVRYCLERQKYFPPHVAQPSLFGIYDVREFIRENVVLPPLLTETSRWRTAIFQASGPAGRSWVSIRKMDDSWQTYRTEYHANPKAITISDPREQTTVGRLIYVQEADQLTLIGTLKDERLRILLRRLDESKYPLLRK